MAYKTIPIWLPPGFIAPLLQFVCIQGSCPSKERNLTENSSGVGTTIFNVSFGLQHCVSYISVLYLCSTWRALYVPWYLNGSVRLVLANVFYVVVMWATSRLERLIFVAGLSTGFDSAWHGGYCVSLLPWVRRLGPKLQGEGQHLVINFWVLVMVITIAQGWQTFSVKALQTT